MTEEQKNPPAALTPRERVDLSAAAQGIADGECALKEENSSAPLSSVTAKSISQRKLDANRANAKKSTGPRTTSGQAHSRRNAVRHGLTSTTVLFHREAPPQDAELRELWQHFHEKFGSCDAATDALIDNAVTEWAHQREAITLEQGFSEMATPEHSRIGLASFHRYLTKSHRALLRTLRLLQHKLAESPKGGKLRTAARLTRTEGGTDDP